MQQYHRHIDHSYRKGAKKAAAYGFFVGTIMFLANSAILVVIYYGAILVIDGDLDVGKLTSFVLYTIYIALGLAEFSSLYTEFMNALGASERSAVVATSMRNALLRCLSFSGFFAFWTPYQVCLWKEECGLRPSTTSKLQHTKQLTKHRLSHLHLEVWWTCHQQRWMREKWFLTRWISLIHCVLMCRSCDSSL